MHNFALNLRHAIRKVFCLSCIFLFLTAAIHAAEKGYSISFHEPATFKVKGHRFDLATTDGRIAFRAYASKLVGEETTLAKKDRLGLREMLRCLDSQDSSEVERSEIQRRLCEIAAAVANNRRPVIPPYVGLPDLPFRFIDSLSNPVAKGRTPAGNLQSCGDKISDISLIDPIHSTFWQRPASIGSADLYAGFDRAELPRFHERVWDYSGPKKAGGNPGCDLAHGSRRIKVKFAETHSEPFAARIFHALGFYVDPTDYAPSLKLKYDRRFFQEFDSLPQIKMKIGIFFVPIHTFHFERTYDPFAFIGHAVLRDKSTVSGPELKPFLLRNPKSKDLFAPGNFRHDAEAAIDHLVTVEANIQSENDWHRNIGPWDFGGLGHENLRELRGAGVLCAWLSWWDSRFENTRLRVVETPDGTELRHYFSDLGSGLGLSGGTFRHSSEQPNEFASTFTRSVFRQKQCHIQFPGYEPIEDTPAFKEITLDDARWMARLIGQLTEAQICDALIASGFNPELVRHYTEKLISRRNQLIHDTQLDGEIAPIVLMRQIRR